LVGLGAQVIVLLIGVPLGAIAGYYGGVSCGCLALNRGGCCGHLSALPLYEFVCRFGLWVA